MTVNYASYFSVRQTPQSEPIPGKSMVLNSAGAFSFAVDDWVRLDRFLVLGNDGGSYYATERKMTIDNAGAVQRCLAEDGVRVVNRIAEISKSGRAPKNDPAIFALALAAGTGNEATKQAAFEALTDVCRIPTHLFFFVEAVQGFRGWGRGLRNAVATWYRSRSVRDCAYQCVKYQNRNGWSHRDLLRLCHATANEPMNSVFHWVVKGWPDVGEQPHDNQELLPIWAFERAKLATTKQEIVRLIREYDLVRECVPTKFLKEPEVWEALLEKMPLTALVRNLATMTRIGLLAPMSAGTSKVLAELTNAERIHKSRLHPVAILAALMTYRSGHGERGRHTWVPVAQIVDALDGAFYQSFGNIEPTGKRWLLAIDTSTSMTTGSIAGVPGLHPRMGAAALALVTAHAEKQHVFAGFTTVIAPLAISPRQRLDDAVKEVARHPCGGTDCSLPFTWATEQRLPVDVFVVLTDSQSWVGGIHASQALNIYRQKMGIPAKAICCGMVANEFTVLDPEDAGSLNVVGFDLAVPSLMNQFAVS